MSLSIVLITSKAISQTGFVILAMSLSNILIKVINVFFGQFFIRVSVQCLRSELNVKPENIVKQWPERGNY